MFNLLAAVSSAMWIWTVCQACDYFFSGPQIWVVVDASTYTNTHTTSLPGQQNLPLKRQARQGGL